LLENSTCMMPKVESEILEAAVSKSVKDIFDPLTQQIEELTQKLEEINARDNHTSNRNKPRILSSFNLRPLPLFTGGFGESFSEFIEKMKQNLILQRISLEENDFMIAYLESFLGGSALAFFKATKLRTNSPKTFKDWVEKIKLKFPDGRDCDVHQLLLFDRRQKLSETVVEYAEELRKLAKLAYPELDSRAQDNIICPVFLRGIKTQIKDVIKFREYDSLIDSIKSATHVESQLFRDDLAINSNINNSNNLIGSMMPFAAIATQRITVPHFEMPGKQYAPRLAVQTTTSPASTIPAKGTYNKFKKYSKNSNYNRMKPRINTLISKNGHDYCNINAEDENLVATITESPVDLVRNGWKSWTECPQPGCYSNCMGTRFQVAPA